MDIHIIYLKDAVVLSKQSYEGGWQEIQNVYPDYKTSIGPRKPDEVIDYLRNEYADEWDQIRVKVSAFLSGDAVELIL